MSKREHIFEKHRGCEIPHCHICDGGLAYCVVCKGAEGSLPTECPGAPMSGRTQDAVYAGLTNFVGGEWVGL
jgi:hypothetical protein